MKKYVRATVYIVLILLSALSVLQGVKNALRFSQDFQYDAALALRCGIDPYEVSLSPGGVPEDSRLSEFYRIFEESGAPQKMEANQFPSLLMLLFPMTLFLYGTARILWTILNLLFTVLIILLLRRTFLKDADRDVFNILMLLMIAGTPWRNQMGVGQHTLFSFFFFLLSVYLSDKEMTIPSGLALSVSYFKYTLTAPLAVFYLYKKRYREFFISLIPHIIGTFAAALMLGKGFKDMITEPLKVASALAGEGSIDIGALTGGSVAGYILTILIMVLCVAASFFLPEGKDRMFFSLLILLSLIMTYHRTYDFFVLSAAAAGTCLGEHRDSGTDLSAREKVILCFYALTLLTFFFLLRVFNENTPSLFFAAGVYYLNLIVYTCRVITHSRTVSS